MAMTRAQVTLRWIEVVLYVSTFIFSLLVCVPIFQTTKDFNGKCILYADVAIKLVEENGSLVGTVQASGTTWGEFKTCGYTMYTNIYVCVYVVVMCCIFIFLTKKDRADEGPQSQLKELPGTHGVYTGTLAQNSSSHSTATLPTNCVPGDWRNRYLNMISRRTSNPLPEGPELDQGDKADKLVFPTLLFNTVLFTFELIGSCVLSLGLRKWCLNLESKDEEQGGFTCESTQYLKWPNNINGGRFYILLTISEIASWLATITAGGLSAIAAERFCRSVWAPTFRYTIRYENGLVGMDMKNIVDNASYNTMENSVPEQGFENSQGSNTTREPTELEVETNKIQPAGNSLAGCHAGGFQNKSDANPVQSPWASEKAPLKKKYVVVYSSPPGYSIPEDMQLISTV
ncbi:uncharacterized protein LOC135484288 isoform X2 [Lineus longissimus]|uniref:uncharacterized protein LOC135484288 isoform X2 n=1 Tax=Lineus longissimus TaxID=88925 RepID=UPI002B4D380C